jgi:hypothetical protein
MPFDVSAAQFARSPGFDAHDTVAAGCAPLVVPGVVADPAVCASLVDAHDMISPTTAAMRTGWRPLIEVGVEADQTATWCMPKS